MESLGLYGSGGCDSAPYANDAKMIRMPSMKERIAQSVRDAESRLADARRAKEIFDAHPELEELLNIMQRGRF